MQKQILYPNFINRIFATLIDLVIVLIATTPIINYLGHQLFIINFQELFIKQGLDIYNKTAISQVISNGELQAQIWGRPLLIYLGELTLLNIIPLALYFIGCWHYLRGTTPGKLLARIKIVDSSNYKSPNLQQCIIRFCSMITITISFWRIFTDKQRRAWHDKLAGTLVIKA